MTKKKEAVIDAIAEGIPFPEVDDTPLTEAENEARMAEVKKHLPKVKLGGKIVAVSGVEFHWDGEKVQNWWTAYDWRDVAPESWWNDPKVPCEEGTLVDALEELKIDYPGLTKNPLMRIVRRVSADIVPHAPKSQRKPNGKGKGGRGEHKGILSKFIYGFLKANKDVEKDEAKKKIAAEYLTNHPDESDPDFRDKVSINNAVARVFKMRKAQMKKK
jgi:hypothetical protein